jgi:hypothetical protein
MAIHLGQFEAGSHLKRHEYIMELCTLPAALVTAYANTLALSTKVAGNDTGVASQYTRQPLNLYLTLACGTTAHTVQFRVNGENQFGDTVTELVNIAGVASSTNNAFTQNCYRRITSITIEAITVGGSPLSANTTLSVGFTNLAGARYPIWSRTLPLAAIKALVYAGSSGGVANTFTFDKTYNNIRDAGAGAQNGMVCLILDPKYERYV